MAKGPWDKDIVVIGGGAAGMTAAQYGARANLDTLLLERYAFGGQALIISELENYPGFSEMITGFDFSQRMEQQARNFGAELVVNEVLKLEREGELFSIKTKTGVVRTPSVILATGAVHRPLGVEGEERLIGRGVSYCASCDGPFFKGKKILVVGGGDAACDEAHYLSNLSDKIVLIHRRAEFRAQDALANRVRNNGNIEVRLSQVALEVLGENKVQKVRLKDLATDKVYEEEFDAVFIFVGSIPITDLAFPEVEKDGQGFIEVNEHMESAVPGFFAIGDARRTPFRQLAVGVGDAALAAHAAAHRVEDLSAVG
ncbi:FAD-dependent oxidoreductase [Candidatus Haliotispira prima]|uniref:FAD-dependent oxidoreductase n=1 Tax=Candidatus Haliotispira prima TaxID=3034016 RepID=A0ABY8ME13_9SPIO|nr:FAD-dependent oxidoreductase [Candidatus Haliotispira prima]